MLFTVSNEIISLFLIIGLGLFLRKKEVITEGAEICIANFTLYVAIPAMLIFSLYSAKIPETFGEMVVITAISYVFVTVFALLVVRLLPTTRRSRMTMAFMMVFTNVVNIGYPVLQAIFGDAGIVCASVFNLAYNLLIWTVGVWMLRDEKKPLRFKQFLTPGLLAVLAGYALRLLNIRLPDFLLLSLQKLGGSLVPLAMVLIGCALTKLRLGDVLRSRLNILFIVLKQLALPLAFFFLMLLTPLDRTVVKIAVVLISMPTAVSAVAFVRGQGADHATAAQGVVLSTLVALPMVPVLLFIMNLFG